MANLSLLHDLQTIKLSLTDKTKQNRHSVSKGDGYERSYKYT